MFPGEWVLCRVLGVDDHGTIGPLEVLYHNPRRQEVSKALRSVWRSDPKAHLSVVLGGFWATTGDEAREALKRANEQDYVNVRW
jgi:hypothetical protein